MFGRTREAVLETLRICKDRDVLKKYLEEQEAAEIMFTWLDEQKARKFEYEEIKQEARTEDIAEGLAKGEAKGRTEGRTEGKLEAYAIMVRKNRISVKEAAEETGLSEKDFCEQAGLPIPQ